MPHQGTLFSKTADRMAREYALGLEMLSRMRPDLEACEGLASRIEQVCPGVRMAEPSYGPQSGLCIRVTLENDAENIWLELGNVVADGVPGACLVVENSRRSQVVPTVHCATLSRSITVSLA